jgi:hypothetical protein
VRVTFKFLAIDEDVHRFRGLNRSNRIGVNLRVIFHTSLYCVRGHQKLREPAVSRFATDQGSHLLLDLGDPVIGARD